MRGEPGDYLEIGIGDFGMSKLLCYRGEKGELIGLGAHAGLVDGRDRIRDAHLRWARLNAAGQAARALPDDFYDAMRVASPPPLPRGLMPREGVAGLPYRDLVFEHVAFALSGEDPYKAFRTLERELGGDFDRALYDRFVHGMDGVWLVAGRPATLEAAARKLSAASPGPATLMRRMLAAHLRQPEPREEPLPGKEQEGREARFIVGSVVVTPGERSRHRHAGRPVEVTATIEFDTGSVEFDEEGVIEAAFVELRIHMDPATWTEDDGSIYGNGYVEDAVTKLLETRGLGRYDHGWSEQGRQTAMVGDMDVDPRIAEAIWPDVVARLREEARGGPAPA